MASAAVGGLVLLCLSSPVAAQDGAPTIARVASLSSGSIAGLVQDERGTPVSGAIVSAVGATTVVASTDRLGRFELRTLSPGPYLVRARMNGFVAPRGQVVEVRASARSSSSIELRRVTASAPSTTPPAAPAATIPVLTASVAGENGSAPETAAPAPENKDPKTIDTSIDEDHGEVAWRLRHARRGILKDAAVPDDVAATNVPDPAGIFNKPMFPEQSSAPRLATNLLSSMPVTGQFNLLTASSFDSPEQLFSADTFAHSIAYVSLVAPAGQHADWSMRGALTQGDLSSWFLAAAYTTRAQAPRQYDVGFSYSTQRYDGGNPAALREVTDGNRNVGVVYGDDTFAIAPGVSVTYGARYARYGYLSGHGLLSPAVGVTVTPADGFRISARASSQALAPGAEEFQPPSEAGIWLPPQRTFSSVGPEETLQSERTSQVALSAERDLDALGASAVSLRAFHQRVSDQMVTMFGMDTPDAPGAEVGHYFIGDAGNVDATGWSAGFRSTALSRVRGSVEYTTTYTSWSRTSDTAYMILLAPVAVRPLTDRIQDLSTSIETNVPETATRVLVVCRLSNLHTMGSPDRTGYDSRFDVQVRQSLPFMDFSNARWEMLLAVRNFFRDASPDSSVYDELLVVRPPKRIVGGLTLRF
jgi:hypothetical protein